MRRVRRRGDDIPPVSAYAHWNEDAERVWYEENRYDMEHADEIIEDEDDRDDEPDPEPFEDSFATEAAARAFAATVTEVFDHYDKDGVSQFGDHWIVDHWDAAAHRRHQRIHS